MSAGIRRHIVTFALGEELFAADVHEVERVLRYRAPSPVPRLPDWVAGLVEHGGRSLPVVDLRRRFQLPTAPSGVESADHRHRRPRGCAWGRSWIGWST